jgi:hypothetical protein
MTLVVALVLADRSVAAAPPAVQRLALDTIANMRPVGVQLSTVDHRGQRALRVAGTPGFAGEQVVVLESATIQDGTIEISLAGQPSAGASPASRGFVGVAFRAADDASRFECFYLRMTNGRSDDQVRRNHSAQYIAYPGFPWQKLRAEHPGVYESYVDLVPGEWTDVRIEVQGKKARLFVHGAEQPVLLVNDLKLEPTVGRVALWIGAETEAWFRDLRITPAATAVGG